jgi:DNA-directed RNA polymerase beta' subunit
MRNVKIVNVKHNNTRKEFSLRIGDIVERKMQNGDIILMNRQPTLHKGSMISQKVKILKGKTFRLNLAITESLNADFDGDEMNCYLPSDIPSQFELENLSTVDNIINSSSSNRANIKVVQDTPLAIYIMTKNKNPINKISFWKILGALKNFNYEHFQEKILIFKQEKKEENIFTGDFLFSLLLKNDFSFENNNLTISKGILTKGIVSKSDINKIISLLYLDYQNIDIVKEFKLCLFVVSWIFYRFTRLYD